MIGINLHKNISRRAIFLAPGMQINGNKFTEGVGGTEAATILMAETLSSNGWEVLIASGISGEVMFGGVRYLPIAAIEKCKCDVLGLVNSWSDVVYRCYARHRINMYHDTLMGGRPDTLQCVRWADWTIVDSVFGLNQVVPGVPLGLTNRIVVVPIPIRLQDYTDASPQRKNMLLYSSMPDRGLIHLARWFPEIKSRVSDVELHITGDFSMYGRPGAKLEYEQLFLRSPGVHYHGRVSRAQLVDLQKSAKVLAFPCTFPEGFCIAAAEAMSAGTVPVTSDAFALSTTVGPAGVLIPGHPGGGRRRAIQRWLYGKRFVRNVIRLLTQKDEWQAKSDACKLAVDRFSPAKWYETFLKLLDKSDDNVP